MYETPKYSDPRDRQAELPVSINHLTGKAQPGGQYERPTEAGNDESNSGSPLRSDGSEKFPDKDQQGTVERVYPNK
jgi:hypothetical protein